MAYESLKDPYRGIEADEQEMARYRAALRPLLRPRRSRAWLLLPAAAAVALLWLIPAADNSIPRLDLPALQSFAAAAPERVLAKAGDLASGGEGIDRWNSIMLLCLRESGTRAVELAARGLQEDPRADFRAYYLEYLLDHADGYRYNLAMLEELMDRESDPQCLRLYREMRNITRYFGE